MLSCQAENSCIIIIFHSIRLSLLLIKPLMMKFIIVYRPIRGFRPSKAHRVKYPRSLNFIGTTLSCSLNNWPSRMSWYLPGGLRDLLIWLKLVRGRREWQLTDRTLPWLKSPKQLITIRIQGMPRLKLKIWRLTKTNTCITKRQI